MKNNILVMVDKVLSDEKLCAELANKQTFEEVYEFCISVSGGYTSQELSRFVDKHLRLDLSIPQELSDEEIMKVSGGSQKDSFKNIAMKLTAYSLAALTAISSANILVFGKSPTPVSIVSKSITQKDKEPSFFEKYRKWFIGAGIAVAAIGAVALGAFAGQKLHQKFHPKNPVLADINKGKQPLSPLPQKNKKSIHANSCHKCNGCNNEDEQPLATVLPQKKINSFLNKLFSLPYVGGALVNIGVVLYFISGAGDLAKQIINLDNLAWPIRRLVETFKEWKKKIANKFRKKKKITINNCSENLNELFVEIKGQEEAKRKVKEQVLGIFHRRQQALSSNKKYTKGDVLYFVGPSGVGKTLMAEGLARYNVLSSNPEPFHLSASAVDKKSSASIVEQLFAPSRMEYGSHHQENNRVTTLASLVKYLGENRDGVVIIDEYDKIWCEELDAIFMDIVDNGVVNVKNQKIDCSGITFILTSNEVIQTIHDQAPAKEIINKKFKDRTFEVQHHQAFLNRLSPIEFKNLSPEEYQAIASHHIQEDIVNYWANYKGKGATNQAVDIVVSSNCTKNMAKTITSKNQGARYLHTRLLPQLFSDISTKVIKSQEENKPCGKLFVEFDPDLEGFVLSERSLTPTELYNIMIYTCTQFIKSKINDTIVQEWATRTDYYNKDESVEIVITDECYSKMAEFIKSNHYSVEYIQKLRDQLSASISEEVYKELVNNMKCKEIFVDFSKEKGDFILTSKSIKKEDSKVSSEEALKFKAEVIDFPKTTSKPKAEDSDPLNKTFNSQEDLLDYLNKVSELQG